LCVTERGHIKDTKHQQTSFECVLFSHCAANFPSFEFQRMFCGHYLLCISKEINCPNYIMHLYQQILTPYVVCEVFMLSATSVRPVTTISPHNCKLTLVPLKHLEKIIVFWCVMPYCLVNRCKLCGETCFCHLQVRGKKNASHPVEDRRLSALHLPSLPFAAYSSAQKVVAVGSVNVSTCPPDYMASHPTRLIPATMRTQEFT